MAKVWAGQMTALLAVQEFKQLICRCLRKDPAQRATATQLLLDPVLKVPHNLHTACFIPSMSSRCWLTDATCGRVSHANFHWVLYLCSLTERWTTVDLAQDVISAQKLMHLLFTTEHHHHLHKLSRIPSRSKVRGSCQLSIWVAPELCRRDCSVVPRICSSSFVHVGLCNGGHMNRCNRQLILQTTQTAEHEKEGSGFDAEGGGGECAGGTEALRRARFVAGRRI